MNIKQLLFSLMMLSSMKLLAAQESEGIRLKPCPIVGKPLFEQINELEQEFYPNGDFICSINRIKGEGNKLSIGAFENCLSKRRELNTRLNLIYSEIHHLKTNNQITANELSVLCFLAGQLDVKATESFFHMIESLRINDKYQD
jgi:hypothetical protein